MAGNIPSSFRPHTGSISNMAHHGNTSPTMNSSAWPAPLNANSHVPGAYPLSPNTQPIGVHPGSQVSLAGQRPHSPLPPAGTHDPSLWPLFMAVDIDRSGQLTQIELSSALKNDEYTSFDPETVRMMIKMFDNNGNGTIDYEEFCGLWSFLAAWRTLFQRFDEDRSGFISYAEYSNALTAFGYSLSSEFVTMMYRIYDRRKDERMTFDLFVQSCIQLKRMTDVFKKYDNDRDGFITLGFEEFLTGKGFFHLMKIWRTGYTDQFDRDTQCSIDRVSRIGEKGRILRRAAFYERFLFLLLFSNDLVSFRSIYPNPISF